MNIPVTLGRLRVLLRRIDEWEEAFEVDNSEQYRTDLSETVILDIKQCLESILLAEETD